MKYGWEIADEVRRFSSNSADIQWVARPIYDALATENEQLRNQIEYLEERLDEYYNLDDQALEKELNQLRQAKTELSEALNWIGAIRCSPKKSWPTHEVIAEVANEALDKWAGET